MKTQLLLIPMLLLSACRTTAGTKEKPADSKPSAAQAEVLLRKRIDALSKSQPQVYDCAVTSNDVKNPDEVKKWISEVPRGKDSIVTAMHFRATDPSIEYLAYEGGTDFLIFMDHSTMQFPGDKNGKHPAVEALMKVADTVCTGPAK